MAEYLPTMRESPHYKKKKKAAYVLAMNTGVYKQRLGLPLDMLMSDSI